MMTKSQLDNLINFCFNFHRSMDINMDGCSHDYLLKKWDKYIGVKPYTNDSLDITYIREEMRDIRKYRTLGTTPLGLDREDIRRIESLSNWSDKWISYHCVKEILYFISVVNSKGFYIDDNCWSPSQLVDIFREWVGDPEDINKEPYKHLHSNLEREVNMWLKETANNRDYKLCSLI